MRSGWQAVIISMRTYEGTTSSWRESAELLLDKFFPRRDINEDVNDRVDGQVNEAVGREFSEEEVTAAIGKVRMKRAADLNCLKPEIVRCAWWAIATYIIELYNRCVREEYVPRERKKAQVSVLLKSAEKLRSDLRSYKPICILPMCRKVFKKMLVNRVVGFS